MAAPRILVVDDEPNIRKVLAAHLRRMGHEVDVAEDGRVATQLLGQEPFQLVISDVKMPELDGIGLLAWIRARLPGLPVILVTAYATVPAAVAATRDGAFDYVSKPFDVDELQAVVRKALATEARNTRRLVAEGSTPWVVGDTPRMRTVARLVEKVADSPATVLVTGETGTGKEVVARSIHALSSRRNGPFVQINCGAIPDTLFESELFGYEKGAFTGAVHTKPGRFELAQGGTLFLDEIGELPRDLQVKLLRALQERKIDRVGGIREIEIDVRVIAATHVDLAQRVADGQFREDLYYRLHVVPIDLPPLRDRLDDLPVLAAQFVERFSARLARRVHGIDPDAMALLLRHRWPGNIRELENVLERAVLLADGEQIRLEDLDGLGPPADALPSGDGLDLKEYVRVHTSRLERERIRRALDAEECNVTRAARRLGISRKSLQLKMKDYGLREDD